MINSKICLIHNNDKERVSLFLLLFKNMKKKFISNGHNADFMEVSWQSLNIKFNFLSALIRGYLIRSVERRWSFYLGLRRENIFLFYLYLVVSYYRNLKMLNWRRKSKIEISLVAKHIQAWVTFLNTDADFLVCFEDDVISKDNSVDRLIELISYLEVCSEKYIYIDLAGGFDIDALNVGCLIKSSDFKDYTKFKKPVTNTTCAYLISRALAGAFLEIINSNPMIRLLPADLLINHLFMELKNVDFFCMHSTPSVFIHGSMNDYYSSSIR